MRAAIVGNEHLGTVWPRIEAMLIPAIEQSGGRYTVDSTRAAITRGEMQLWVAYEGSDIYAAMTSAVTVYPARKMLAVVHCGGRMLGLWVQQMAEVETWAKEQGCDGIEIVGRAGWAKVLPGYHKTGAIVERNFA